MRLLGPGLLKQTAEGVILVGQECQQCGKVAFPRKRVCPDCFSTALEEKALSRTGTLHTYTCVHLGAPHLDPPYVLGFVDLPEKIRLLTLLTDCDPWEDVLQVGMPMEMVVDPMEMVVDPLRQGGTAEDDVYCYRFRPVRSREVGG